MYIVYSALWSNHALIHQVLCRLVIQAPAWPWHRPHLGAPGRSTEQLRKVPVPKRRGRRHWSLRPGAGLGGLWGWAWDTWGDDGIGLMITCSLIHTCSKLLNYIEHYWTMIPWFRFSSLVICLNYESLHFSSFDSFNSLGKLDRAVMSADRGQGVHKFGFRAFGLHRQGCCFTFFLLTHLISFVRWEFWVVWNRVKAHSNLELVAECVVDASLDQKARPAQPSAGPSGWCYLCRPPLQAGACWVIYSFKTEMWCHHLCPHLRQQKLGIIAFSRLDPDLCPLSQLCRAQVLSNAFATWLYCNFGMWSMWRYVNLCSDRYPKIGQVRRNN